jgi:hypothetical protein
MTLWRPPKSDSPQAVMLRERAMGVFLTILQRLDAEGRYTTDASTSTSYAPKVFAAEQEARDAAITQHYLAVAMEQLIREGTIKRIVEGSGGRAKQRLVIV